MPKGGKRPPIIEPSLRLGPDDFPSPPPFHCEWAPIQLEPVLLSGERLTVAVAVRSVNDGSILAVPVFNDERLSCLLGAKTAAAIGELIRVTVNSLQCFAGALTDWRSPFSSVSMSRPRELYTNNAQEALQVAFRNSAGLGVWRMEDAEDREQEDTLPRRIRDLVVTNRRDLEANFGRSFRIRDKARAARVHYAGIRLAAQFSRLMPGQLGSHIREAKIGIITLVELRNSTGALFTDPARHEIIILSPRSNDDGLYTDRQMDDLEEARLEVTELCLAEDLNAAFVPDVVQAAARIIEQEAA